MPELTDLLGSEEFSNSNSDLGIGNNSPKEKTKTSSKKIPYAKQKPSQKKEKKDGELNVSSRKTVQIDDNLHFKCALTTKFLKNGSIIDYVEEAVREKLKKDEKILENMGIDIDQMTELLKKNK